MKILIVGAGIGGCAIAERVQHLGHSAILIDRHSGPAKETSAHNVALAHPHYAKAPSRLQRITQFANQLVVKKWADFRIHEQAFQRLSSDDWISYSSVEERLKAQGYSADEVCPLDISDAENIVGIHAHGVLFKQAGVYDLPAICQSSIQKLPSSNLFWNQTIHRMIREQDQWQVFNENDELIVAGDAIILANGIDAKRLLSQLGIQLNLRVVRGQLSRFVIDPKSDWNNYLPKVALCGDGYCVPPIFIDGKRVWQVGSSYDEEVYDVSPSSESDLHNQQQASNLIAQPSLSLNDLKPIEPFVGLRCVGSDRMPLIGPIPTQNGLFLATAFGARGVLWSALAQELIAEYLQCYFADEAFLRAGFLAGASDDFSSELASAVAPARFLAGLLRGRGSNSKPIFPSAPRTK